MRVCVTLSVCASVCVVRVPLCAQTQMLSQRARGKGSAVATDADTRPKSQGAASRSGSCIRSCACVALVLFYVAYSIANDEPEATFDADADHTPPPPEAVVALDPTLGAGAGVDPTVRIARGSGLAAGPATVNRSGCEWVNDELVGTCFGLRCGDNTAKSAAECEAECCKRGEKCITWQYRKDIGCCLGPKVRLGFERSRSPHWCEPTPPSPWTGRRIQSRKRVRAGNACEWGPDELGGQCFGLGAKRSPDTVEGCRQACCGDVQCELWQWRDDKGCFYGRSNHCELAKGDALRPYTGHRKPVDPERVDRNGWLTRRPRN